MPPSPSDRALAPLGEEGRRSLAASLLDTPFHCIEIGLLKRGLCRAYLEGPAAHPKAAVVQPDWGPTEPFIFGTDAEALWGLLSRIDGWDCVNVSLEWAPAVAQVLERELGLPSRFYGDPYYVLESDPVPHTHPQVRRLGPEDASWIEGSPREVQPRNWGSVEATLQEGIAAGGIAEGRLVSIVQASVPSRRYQDIGATTLAPRRGEGLAPSAAFLVCAAVRAQGRVPVWSTGEDNHASQRVAEKVGFRRFGALTYVVFDGLKPEGFISGAPRARGRPT